MPKISGEELKDIAGGFGIPTDLGSLTEKIIEVGKASVESREKIKQLDASLTAMFRNNSGEIKGWSNSINEKIGKTTAEIEKFAISYAKALE